MVATNRQRTANRRNAQYSTGPKSSLGKKRSALNSLRHGLSCNKCLPMPGADLKGLEQILLNELEDLLSVNELCIKILDYERTDAYLRDIAQQEKTNNSCTLDDDVFQKLERDSATNEALIISFQRQLNHVSLSKPEKEKIKWSIDALKFQNKFAAQKVCNDAKNAEQEIRSARRYYKRAINQLVKAIKAVSL